MSDSFAKLEAKGGAFGGWNFHFVFTPAYRVKVFKVEAVKMLCRKVAREVAERLDFRIQEDDFGPDQWHVFVTGAKNFSAPEIARRLKGATSRRVRQELATSIKPYLWGDHFWSHAYFSETIGRVSAKTVAFYVARSQRKHWQPQGGQRRLAEFS